jgi:hypothetical protein
MKGIRRALFAFSLTSLSIVAQAGPVVNGCVTPEGGPLFGDDTARDQCKDAPIRRFNPDGSEGALIPSPLTPEDRKNKEERARKVAECNKQNKDRKQKDDALMDRYPSEDNLQDARFDALGKQLRRVNEANERMREIIAKGRGLAEQAGFFKSPHRMPFELQADLEANDQLVRSQIGVIEDAARAIRHINDIYDADLKRYRELVNDTAAMSCSAKE